MAYENYTVRQFENALYRDDRTVMSQEILDEVYTEYVDTAGLYESEEFDKVSYIYYLDNRVNSIRLSIKLQKEFLSEFGKPYVNGLKFLKKFGHNVYWNDNVDAFLRSLDVVEGKEKRYISQLEKNVNELFTLRKNKNNEDVTKKQAKPSFIKMVNSLGKSNYKIDKDVTTVEELSWMIRQQKEEVEELKNKK